MPTSHKSTDNHAVDVPQSQFHEHITDKPKLDKRDVLALILATYRATLPYLLVFIILFVVGIWLVTEVFLR
ncbi:MAG: hypothetical protein AAF267_09735 [Deinococcota bacterium]